MSEKEINVVGAMADVCSWIYHIQEFGVKQLSKLDELANVYDVVNDYDNIKDEKKIEKLEIHSAHFEENTLTLQLPDGFWQRHGGFIPGYIKIDVSSGLIERYNQKTADCVAVASNGEVMPENSADAAEDGLVDNEPVTA